MAGGVAVGLARGDAIALGVVDVGVAGACSRVAGEGDRAGLTGVDVGSGEIVVAGKGVMAGFTGVEVGTGEIVAPGAGDTVGLAAGAVIEAGSPCTPKMLGSPVSNTPARQAIIIVARVPANSAFQPSSEISLRREGIRAMVPPTKMPTEARWANPERA